MTDKDREAEEPAAEDSPSGGDSPPRGFIGLRGSELLGEGIAGLQKSLFADLKPTLDAFNAERLAGFSELSKSIAQMQGISTTASRAGALMRYLSEVPALSKAADYAGAEEEPTAYSQEMESPASYFSATERVISNFAELHQAITQLISKTPDLPLLWRGVRNAEWGLHSHLYRQLMKSNGVAAPSERPRGAQPYPDEDQMVAAEAEILRLSRDDWRFDDLSALEMFARIQHAGGPTRLLDVTKNPYIGAWFAVEFDEREEDHDARLFALATRPVAREGKPPAPDPALKLDDLGAARDPFWHLLSDRSLRQSADWGTGARRRVWVPPAYDPRISAQNAAFIIDGVPMTSAKTASYFRIDNDKYWRRSDLLASSSIYAKMLRPNLKPRYNSKNFAPTFSFRIKAEAKAEIREVMESRFGYRMSYVYPDVAALAGHLKTLKFSR